MDYEGRFVDIEIKLAFQENTIAQLDHVVCRQQAQIDELLETCARLMARMRELAGSAALPASTPGCEKPPHY